MSDIASFDHVLEAFIQRGDLAHVALFLWACGASALLVWVLRELTNAHRRYEQFVAELARLNKLFGQD